MSTYFKRFLKKTYFYNYYLERKLKGKYLFKSVTVMNFIFQRLFRINSGVNFSIHYTSTVVSPKNLFTESFFSFAVSGGIYVQAKNYVFVGKDVLIAPGVKIISSNHEINHQKRNENSVNSPIIIGDSCWIGANAVILPGVKLGSNVIVGAGAIVTKSFPSNSVIIGNPAKVLKKIN